jgi:DNA repair exonuclease SbcCD ATPase subunit
MNLKKITLKNFKSFKEEEFILPGDTGLFLLTGLNLKQPRLVGNGAGKSTLLDSICWCLYEKTADGTKAGELLNRKSKGGYSVKLEFDEFTVERSWKPNVLKLNGEELKNEALIERLGLTYIQFLNSIYIPQRTKWFLDLGASDKLQFLSDLFGLDKWIKAGDVCKDQVRILTNEISRLESSKEAKAEELINCDQLKASIEASILSWNEVTKSELIKSELDRLDLLAMIKEIEPQSELEDLIIDVKELIAESSKKQKDIQTQEKLEIEKRAKINVQLSQIVDRIKSIASQEDKQCPKCFQQVGHDHVARLMGDLESEKEILVMSQSTMQESSKLTESDLKSVESDLKEGYETLSYLQDRLSNSKSEKIQQDRINKQIRDLDLQIEKIKTKVNPFLAQVNQIDERLRRIELDITQQSGKIIEHSDLSEKYKFWQTKFPQIRLTILSEIADQLELAFEQSFSRLGIGDWQVKVLFERELKNEAIKKEFSIQIISDGKDINVSTLSGGEKQRVCIAVQLGISDVVRSRTTTDCDLLMIDEPSNGLNDAGLDDMLSLFRETSSTLKVFLAEHRLSGSYEASFDKIYKVIKSEEECSTIVAN